MQTEASFEARHLSNQTWWTDWSEKRRSDMEGKRRRPYKICDSERTKTTGIVAESLQELKDRASLKFGVTAANCRVFLDSDGTEIEEEEYFSFLEDQTKLMIASEGEEWTAVQESSSSSQGRTGSGSLGASLEMNESLEFDRIDAGETTETISSDLLIRIKNDPAFFISFSDESLHDVINFETEQLSTALGRSLAEAQHSQEACQQELDRRMQLREATQLLKLFERARQNQDYGNDVQSGNKRPRTVHE